MERFSILFIIRDMQFKTTMKYHLTLFRMSFSKKTNNNKCGQECEERGALIHFWWECKLCSPLWKTVWRYLKKRCGFHVPLPASFRLSPLWIQKYTAFLNAHCYQEAQCCFRANTCEPWMYTRPSLFLQSPHLCLLWLLFPAHPFQVFPHLPYRSQGRELLYPFSTFGQICGFTSCEVTNCWGDSLFHHCFSGETHSPVEGGEGCSRSEAPQRPLQQRDPWLAV